MTENWISRVVHVRDYDGWAFLKADRNLGAWRPKAGSPNTLEQYVIGVAGTWVPSVDASWLLGFRKWCACNAKRRVWMFAQLTPTKRQMGNRPDRPPRLRVEKLSKFGLVKAQGD